MRHRFPVLLNHVGYQGKKEFGDCPKSIPWKLIASHEFQANKNHGQQTLKRLAKRGGLSPSELVAVLEDRRWMPMATRNAIKRLKELIGM